MKYSLKKDEKMGVHDTYYYIDENGCSYESPIQWLWIGILGGCGCGTSDRLAKRAWKVLSYFASDWDEREKNNYSVHTIPADELLAHWLTHKDLLEHGGTVGGSWLTEEGKNVYKIIKRLTPTELNQLKGTEWVGVFAPNGGHDPNNPYPLKRKE